MKRVIVLISVVLCFFNCDQPTDSEPGDSEQVVPDGMVKIAAAGQSFEMGQPDPDIGGEGNSDVEQPVHTVEFTYDFWMDTVEVTQAKYEEVMSNAYSGYSTPELSNSIGDDYPIHNVLWGDAALYCNARSLEEGYDTVYTYDSISGIPGFNCELVGVSFDLSANGYRLPTEAEWEYAYKGGTQTDYYWNRDYEEGYPSTQEDSVEINENAVWRGNSYDLNSSDPDYGPHPVGSKKPNNYGLYDMAGNLTEWCNDYYGEYESGPVTDPQGPETGNQRSVRGGNWGNHAIMLRATNRDFSAPNYAYAFVGFRLVKRVE